MVYPSDEKCQTPSALSRWPLKASSSLNSLGLFHTATRIMAFSRPQPDFSTLLCTAPIRRGGRPDIASGRTRHTLRTLGTSKHTLVDYTILMVRVPRDGVCSHAGYA